MSKWERTFEVSVPVERVWKAFTEESEMLLRYLTRWAANTRFTVRYHWTPGTIAMWDNRCTQHYVLDDFEGERVIQRVTVMGDLPEAASPPRWEPYRRAISAASRHDRQLASYLRKHST